MNKESRLADKDLLNWFFNYVIDKLNEDKELSNYYYDIWKWRWFKHRLNYKWCVKSIDDLPKEWNEEWDFYIVEIIDEPFNTVREKYIWYNNQRFKQNELQKQMELLDNNTNQNGN